MHVSSIIPVLLNIILSDQQSRKQAPREQVILQTTHQMKPPGTVAAETKPRPQNATGEPALIPLPLKSPLFPDTQFFVFHRHGQEKHNRRDGESETGIVFSLATTSLGRLFFLLTRREQTINITCYVENAAVAARLKARSAELEQQVREAGFHRVILRWALLEHGLAGPLKDLTTPGLLDRKV